MDDSTGSGVLAAVGAELAGLWEQLVSAETRDLETAEGTVRERMLAIGARVLEAGLAARGTGPAGPRHSCACGGMARFEG